MLVDPAAVESTLTEPHERSFGITLSWGEPAVVTALTYMFHPYGFGYHLDRCRLHRDLASIASDAGGTLLLQTRAQSLRQRSDGNLVGRLGTISGLPLLLGKALNRLVVRGRSSSGTVCGRLHDRRGPGSGGVTAIRRVLQEEFSRTTLIRSRLPQLASPTEVVARSAGTSILEPMHGTWHGAVGEAESRTIRSPRVASPTRSSPGSWPAQRRPRSRRRRCGCLRLSARAACAVRPIRRSAAGDLPPRAARPSRRGSGRAALDRYAGNGADPAALGPSRWPCEALFTEAKDHDQAATASVRAVAGCTHDMTAMIPDRPPALRCRPSDRPQS